MSDEIAIKVENVSKTFRLPHEKQNSLKGALINFSKRGYEKQKALDSVSFEVKKGEFFGIVGRNGSGKSTMLKLLAGIYRPSKGNIQVNGKLTPFIELGVGFNMELTGRENVYLNGALLGFSRKEMSAMYKDIVEFAELERFMDQKLKNYSSGMQVRLAFSIAIRAESDILLIDEVLAVGDNAFQKKCRDYFYALKENKQTVILVSHDMPTVEEFCDRAALINDGTLLNIGEANRIAAEYEQINLIKQKAQPDDVFVSHDAKIEKVEINGGKSDFIDGDKDLKVEITFKALKDVTAAAAISIVRSDGTFLANINQKNDPGLTTIQKGKTRTIECVIGTKELLNGTYRVDTAIYQDDIYLDRFYNAANFTISRPKTTNYIGFFKLDGKWRHK